MAWPKMTCENCGHGDLITINEADSETQLIPTSDGKFIDTVRVLRAICKRCACVGIHYDPADRLMKFFSSEYDISDSVQNNFIVKGNSKLEKHVEIEKNFLENLDGIPKKGNYLEIACGHGELAHRFARQYPYWTCKGIDPSADGQMAEAGSKVEFIQDFFEKKYFEQEKWDVLVAHGILNRTPTLPLLQSICDLARPGAIVSLELLTIEQSQFTPFIWDHSYTFLEETFKEYLESVGLVVLKRYDCVSAWQYVCRFDSSRKKNLNVAEGTVDQSIERCDDLIKRWGAVGILFRQSVNSMAGKSFGLFGAGLYSAVLLQQVGVESIKFVADELKAGGEMAGIPIVDLETVKKIDDCQILLCMRPRYMNFVAEKLKEAGIVFTPLYESDHWD